MTWLHCKVGVFRYSDKYDSSNKKEDIDIRDNYLVNVIAINYEGFLSMFHREYQILLHDEFYEELSED